MSDACPTFLQPLKVPANPITSAARIGYVHLKVTDLDRALAFYCDILGFSLMQKWRARGIYSGGWLSSSHRPQHRGKA